MVRVSREQSLGLGIRLPGRVAAMAPPPAQVLNAWDLPSAERLEGGQGTAYRAGTVVLKPVENAERFAVFSEALRDVPLAPGVRISGPVLSRRGAWVVEGWAAWEWIEGSDHAMGCRELLEVAERFHRAVAGVPLAAVRPGDDRWSTADRAAWGEGVAPLPSALSSLAARRRNIDKNAQLIHGDLAGNVVWHDELAPRVIDLSPYWRPAAYADAIVIVDSVAYRQAGPDVVEEHVRVHGDQLLIRAVLFRVGAAPDELAAYQPVAEWLLS